MHSSVALEPDYGYTVGDALIRVEGVNLSFEGRRVLRDVNVEIKDIVGNRTIRGQVIGFLGPSGIGKTQLCRILAGLNPPDSGRVLIGPAQKPVRAGMVGLVAQNYLLLDHRTVLGNLVVAAQQIERKTANTRAREMLDRFQLTPFAKHYPAQLSGGQRQRVAIAQQLLCSEHYILMDEPFSGLDPIMSDTTVATIREVADMHSENTIVVVTHDVSAAVSCADVIWMMGREAGLEGARIVAQYDLLERGLAWRPNIRDMPEFYETTKEIRAHFKTLLTPEGVK